MRWSLIFVLMFLTALRVPLPEYLSFSLSRSSTASWLPTDAPEGTPREEPIDLPPAAQSEEATQPQGHPSGIGQEELLLLSLLLLLRGEGTAAEAGEAQELRWMLMLLLLLG